MNDRASLFLAKLRDFNPVTALLVTVGGYFASQMLGAIAVITFGTIRGWNADQMVSTLNQSIWFKLAFSLVVYGFYLLIIRAFLKLSKHTLRDIGLKMPKSWKDIPVYVFSGYGVYLLSTIVSMAIIKSSVTSIDLDQKQDLGIDMSTSGGGLVPVFIMLVIIPPIVEEIVTRGFLYTGLRKKLNVFVAGLITSVVFGAAHLQWGGSAPLLWAAAIDTFILSAILIYIREKTDSLYPAIGLHMLKNFMAFLGLFIFRLA